MAGMAEDIEVVGCIEAVDCIEAVGCIEAVCLAAVGNSFVQADFADYRDLIQSIMNASH